MLVRSKSCWISNSFMHICSTITRAIIVHFRCLFSRSHRIAIAHSHHACNASELEESVLLPLVDVWYYDIFHMFPLIAVLTSKVLVSKQSNLFYDILLTTLSVALQRDKIIMVIFLKHFLILILLNENVSLVFTNLVCRMEMA